MSSEYTQIDSRPFTTPLFYPRADASPPPEGARDHHIEVAPGVTLAARHYHSPASTGTVLYFHGNGEVIPDHDDIAPLYHRISLDLFVVDFRGYGQSTGRPTFSTLLSDAHPVAARFHAFLAATHPTHRRFVMGRSLGAWPACELAARAPASFEALLLESPSASLPRILARLAAPLPPSESDALVAAHLEKLASIRLPTLILHGRRDTLIPLHHAESLKSHLKSAPCTLQVIDNAGHNDILFRGQPLYFDSIRHLTTR
ncbi:MAG: alpha/beta fold hydrolase [Polyangiaceae bacterium]